MKSYICGILLSLLMCAVACSAYPGTKVRGGCLFGNKVYGVGAHTAQPCMRMICDTDGEISFESCPRFGCIDPRMEIIEWLPENNIKPYPDCCARAVCKFAE